MAENDENCPFFRFWRFCPSFPMIPFVFITNCLYSLERSQLPKVTRAFILQFYLVRSCDVLETFIFVLWVYSDDPNSSISYNSNTSFLKWKHLIVFSLMNLRSLNTSFILITSIYIFEIHRQLCSSESSRIEIEFNRRIEVVYSMISKHPLTLTSRNDWRLAS